MKLVPPLFAALACLFATNASAQGLSGHYDAGIRSEPDTQVLAFLRIPLGQQAKKPKDPKIGLGLFTDCSGLANRLSSSHAAACESQTIRSFEVSRDLHARDWLFSFSGEDRWFGFARWYPGLGFARVSETGPILQGPPS